MWLLSDSNKKWHNTQYIFIYYDKQIVSQYIAFLTNCQQNNTFNKLFNTDKDEKPPQKIIF